MQSNKQILEMVAVITKEAQEQDKGQSTSDTQIIKKKVSTNEEDDWFSRVKAQREERREARQQRRSERQAQDD